MTKRAGYRRGSAGMTMAITAMAVALMAAATPARAQVLADPLPRVIPTGTTIALETIATGLAAPNTGTAAPGQPGLLFVADQPGPIWKIDLATLARTAFLNVAAALPPGALIATGERGLLGLAFHPDYATNGLFYTYTSETASVAADFPTPLGAATDHHSVIAEWQVNDPADPAAVADPASRRVLMRIAQPQSNHNGGALALLADATLLIALGDGGSSNDQGAGHSPGGNGQDRSNVLGDVLRIDPLATDAANGQYGVPADNPFHPGGPGPFGGQAGCDDDGLCDEIYASGFRNLFRLSVDRGNGRIYGGDVGQGDIEEVNRIVAGGNYGWPVREGSFCLVPGQGVSAPANCAVPGGDIRPALQYDHDEGISVIGGFVYRGQAAPGFQGRYIFGDFQGGDRQSGRLFYNGKPTRQGQRTVVQVVEFAIAGRDRLGLSVLGFGEDSDGEIYVLAVGPAGGVVEKIVPAR